MSAADETTMAEKNASPTRKAGRIKDARGRLVTQFDPVKAQVLNQTTPVPAETLRTIANDVLPGVRRQKLIQAASVVFGFAFVIGGNIIYFRYFSSWSGLDPVRTAIYALQIVVLFSGPVIVFRMARSQYAGRVAETMLRHLRCPHCGYDIRCLPTSPPDGATVCPECGCAWRLDGTQPVERRGSVVSDEPSTGST